MAMDNENDDLRDRGSIIIAGKIVTLEPYSHSTYKLEIEGTPVANYLATTPPILPAIKTLKESNYFSDEQLNSALKESNWKYFRIALDPEEGA